MSSPPVVLKIERACQTISQPGLNDSSHGQETHCPRCTLTQNENLKLKTQIDDISNIIVELQELIQNHFENMEDRNIINDHCSHQLEQQLIITQQFQQNTHNETK